VVARIARGDVRLYDFASPRLDVPGIQFIANFTSPIFCGIRPPVPQNTPVETAIPPSVVDRSRIFAEVVFGVQ
jgi:hypothetical protein